MPEEWEGIDGVDPIFKDDNIVGGVVMSNPIVSGIPDRSEVFRVALLTDEAADVPTDPLAAARKWLRVFNPAQLQLPEFVVTAPPGQEAGAVDEPSVDVRMSAMAYDIGLCRIRVLNSKVTDEGREVVFEGTEVAGPASDRTMRVLRVTVHANGLASHEVISETPYPG